MNETVDSIFFWGGIFSQWFKCRFTDGTLTYSSSEQYMMYHKAKTFNDFTAMKKIMETFDPRKQKAIGRCVQNFDPAKWDLVKLQIVTEGNRLKFSQNPELLKELLRTNKTIVEGSPTDKVWGVGLKYDDPKILDPKNWQGENLLGVALMTVRDELRSQASL